MTAYTITRDVTVEECNWLPRDLKAGDVVHLYTGPTYGCCGDGLPMTLLDGKTPFFEVPRDALIRKDVP